MNPVLGAVVLASCTGIVSAFIAYWMGRGHGERNLRIVISRYELTQQLNIDLATQLADLRRRLGHLTPDEQTAFTALADTYRKEAS